MPVKLTPTIYALIHFLYPEWDPHNWKTPVKLTEVYMPEDMGNILIWLNKQKQYDKYIRAWIILLNKI